jgi:hypothetical protein
MKPFILPTTPAPDFGDEQMDDMDTMLDLATISANTSTEVMLPASSDDEPDTIELPSMHRVLA